MGATFDRTADTRLTSGRARATLADVRKMSSAVRVATYEAIPNMAGPGEVRIWRVVSGTGEAAVLELEG